MKAKASRLNPPEPSNVQPADGADASALSRISIPSSSRSARSPIRWYALAYVAGILLGWRYVTVLIRNAELWTRRAAAGHAPSRSTT